MRIAFTLIGGSGWTGGVNYLENLLSALHEHDNRDIHPVLFAAADADPATLRRLAPYLAEPPILSRIWGNSRLVRLARLALGLVLQRDHFAEREFRRARIDVVFQHAAWYGCRFGIPTLAWIADFQHRRLPSMFSKFDYYWRDIGYWALSHCATRMMVSSCDAKRDCENYYPHSIGRVDAVPFAVKMTTALNVAGLQEVRNCYPLPDKFLFLPNQLWKHKNHLQVIEALRLIRSEPGTVSIVASGNAKDGRHPDHPKEVLEAVRTYQLEGRFIYLGLIPFQHILPLMQLSAGVLNPSLFEGWSTTVEEAKGVGAPMLLSDLPIHREQAEGAAVFFDPADAEDIAQTLVREWERLAPGPRRSDEAAALQANQRARRRFALSFMDLAARTLAANDSVTSQ